MFKIVFAAACVLYLWIQSFFIHTSHEVIGEHHVFAYNWVALVFAFGFNVIPLGAAWFLWKVKKDRVGAGIFLLVVPAAAVFMLPQLFMERVEVTATHLIHRREPPHTHYDADVAFNEILSAVEIQRETGSFSTHFTTGYILTLRDGRTVELPANTVLTAARDTIDEQLQANGIPVAVQTVLRDSR